jgi:U3 small nucleolar RNA-associated protein 11
MSSMRNAVTRRPHKERAQPQARSKWGLLEKHKDYSLRAADYNKKKEKLAILTTKVRDRHPDEFAYGMINKKQGQHGKGSTENRLSHDAVRLLKTQDSGYLRTVAAKGRKEMRKVQEELGSARVKDGRKTVFVDQSPSPRGKKRSSTGEVLEQIEVNEAVYPQLPELESDEPNEDMVLDENGPKAKLKTKKQLEQEQDAAARLRAARKKRRKLQEVRANKLEMLQRRQKEILAAADQLELQRAKMAKTVGGVNKNGVKFKVRERKR